MTQAVTIDAKTAKEMVNVFQELRLEVVRLRRVLEKSSVYGSKAWWEKSTQRALEEARNGDVYKSKGVADALEFLHT